MWPSGRVRRQKRTVDEQKTREENKEEAPEELKAEKKETELETELEWLRVKAEIAKQAAEQAEDMMWSDAPLAYTEAVLDTRRLQKSLASSLHDLGDGSLHNVVVYSLGPSSTCPGATQRAGDPDKYLIVATAPVSAGAVCHLRIHRPTSSGSLPHSFLALLSSSCLRCRHSDARKPRPWFSS